jgi:hypothetical protein
VPLKRLNHLREAPSLAGLLTGRSHGQTNQARHSGVTDALPAMHQHIAIILCALEKAHDVHDVLKLRVDAIVLRRFEVIKGQMQMPSAPSISHWYRPALAASAAKSAELLNWPDSKLAINAAEPAGPAPLASLKCPTGKASMGPSRQAQPGVVLLAFRCASKKDRSR